MLRQKNSATHYEASTKRNGRCRIADQRQEFANQFNRQLADQANHQDPTYRENARPTLASIVDGTNKADGLNLDDPHKIALEACISDLAPGPIWGRWRENSCEDFLLEFTKKFGTTVLARNTPFACVERFAITQ